MIWGCFGRFLCRYFSQSSPLRFLRFSQNGGRPRQRTVLIENEIRMSNTFLAPGTDDPDERIRSIPERQPEQEQDMDTDRKSVV